MYVGPLRAMASRQDLDYCGERSDSECEAESACTRDFRKYAITLLRLLQ